MTDEDAWADLGPREVINRIVILALCRAPELERAKEIAIARMAGPGEVVVPVVPTNEMIEKGADNITMDCEYGTRSIQLCEARDCYLDMLAARPKQGGNDGQAK